MMKRIIDHETEIIVFAVLLGIAVVILLMLSKGIISTMGKVS